MKAPVKCHKVSMFCFDLELPAKKSKKEKKKKKEAKQDENGSVDEIPVVKTVSIY